MYSRTYEKKRNRLDLGKSNNERGSGTPSMNSKACGQNSAYKSIFVKFQKTKYCVLVGSKVIDTKYGSSESHKLVTYDFYDDFCGL